jgi:hypothetical protein
MAGRSGLTVATFQRLTKLLHIGVVAVLSTSTKVVGCGYLGGNRLWERVDGTEFRWTPTTGAFFILRRVAICIAQALSQPDPYPPSAVAISQRTHSVDASESLSRQKHTRNSFLNFVTLKNGLFRKMDAR